MDMVGLKLSRYHIIISTSSASSKEWQRWNIKQPPTNKQKRQYLTIFRTKATPGLISYHSISIRMVIIIIVIRRPWLYPLH